MQSFLRKVSNWLFVLWAIPLFAWQRWREGARQEQEERKFFARFCPTRRSPAKERMAKEAKKRQDILHLGIAVGMLLLFGCVILNEVGGVPPDVKMLKWVACTLIVAVFMASVYARYTLIFDGAVAADDDESVLLRHTRAGTVSFITASYALCIILAVGEDAGFWLHVSGFVAIVVALLTAVQGLGFVREALKQADAPHTPSAVI